MIYEFERETMVRDQIMARGVTDPRVLDAMLAVPRECFVPEAEHGLAHEDHPLPIGHGQTISQPYVVALMTELLDLPESASVLEIGAGSGYQTAILAHISRHVCAIERDPDLADRARRVLEDLGFGNVELVAGDGFEGWPDPDLRFDGILVACAPDHVPGKLAEALKPGARMVLPVGPPDGTQMLTVVTRQADGSLVREAHSAVRFVPML